MSQTDSDPVPYLVELACPNCDRVIPFVVETEEPVPLMQDVSVPAEVCPDCGYDVSEVGASWDRHREARLHRPDHHERFQEGSA